MLTDNVLKKLELKSARISINSQGRLDLLENGNYFIDDGQRALILDSKGNIVISYSHKVRRINWSYIGLDLFLIYR